MKLAEYQDFLEYKLPCGKVFRISKEDEYLLSLFKYSFSGGYVRLTRYISTEFGNPKEEYYLHRLIVKPIANLQIDHINRDKLDNRRENLRMCSIKQNLNNLGQRNNKSKSKYRGVTYKKGLKKPWLAYSGKSSSRGPKYLGYFSTEKEAALAYNEFQKSEWGSFAFQNEIT